MTLDLLVEPLAVVSGIAAVALTVKQRVINWPIGIVSTALFLYLFIRAGLYADSALQVLYVGLGLYGWWHWLHGGLTGDDLRVSSVSKRTLVIGFVVVVCAVGAVGAFLDASTDSTVPYPDAATTVLSVAAQILLTRKLIESWPVWIFGVNVPYVAIYLYKGLPLTAALQFVFIALSIAGWLEWRRSMLESTSGIPATAPSVTGATA